MKNGEIYSGTLVGKDTGTITLVTASGEAKTFLSRQIASVDTRKKAPEPAPSPQKEISASRIDVPDAPKPFVPSASGKVSLRAGTVLNLRLREVLDGGDPQSELGNVVTTTSVDDIPADGVVIPANSPVTLAVMNAPGSGGREMICSLSGMFLGGRSYSPEGGTHFGGKDPLLGRVSAAPKENLPLSVRSLPLRLPYHSVIQFKLADSVSLREVK